MSWIYILSEDYREGGERHQLWTVGFYKPDGSFSGDSDHSSKDSAAARVHWLNGGLPDYETEILTRAAACYTGQFG